MWADIDKRMDIVKDITRRSATSQEMRAAQGMLLQALAEYDEVDSPHCIKHHVILAILTHRAFSPTIEC